MRLAFLQRVSLQVSTLEVVIKMLADAQDDAHLVLIPPGGGSKGTQFIQSETLHVAHLPKPWLG